MGGCNAVVPCIHQIMRAEDSKKLIFVPLCPPMKIHAHTLGVKFTYNTVMAKVLVTPHILHYITIHNHQTTKILL